MTAGRVNDFTAFKSPKSTFKRTKISRSLRIKMFHRMTKERNKSSFAHLLFDQLQYSIRRSLKKLFPSSFSFFQAAKVEVTRLASEKRTDKTSFSFPLPAPLSLFAETSTLRRVSLRHFATKKEDESVVLFLFHFSFFSHNAAPFLVLS